MKPSASAPASTAPSASSSLVMPQILTRTLISTGQKLFDLRLNASLPQQRFAHEDRIDAAARQPFDIGARLNAAFGYQQPFVVARRGAELRRQSFGRRQIHLERFEVAIIDADQP